MSARALSACLLTALTLPQLAAPLSAQSQPGHVLDGVLLSEGLSGFVGPFTSPGKFGESVCVIGDLDGDDVPDLAVGAPQTAAGPDLGVGTVWILFMEEDGTVRDEARIDAGNVPFSLDAGDRFGCAVAPAGDLDGDGILDLWVGAYGDDDGFAPATFTGPGALYGLLLEKTGAVHDVVKLSAATELPGVASNDGFGYAIAPVGDQFGDGHGDLLVGAPFSFVGPAMEGAVWLLDMGADGKLVGALRLSSAEGDLRPTVSAGAAFGAGVGGVGDLDGNGTPDFAVGAPQQGVVGTVDGALWVYLMEPNGEVDGLVRIAADLPAFADEGPLTGDRFGRSVALIGDIDDDGDDDLVVGANTGGTDRHGAFWCLQLDLGSGDLVETATLVDDDQGFLPFGLSAMDNLGTAAWPLGDWNGDGTPDVVVGLPGWDPLGGPTDEGAVALLFLSPPVFVDLGQGLPGSSAPFTSGGGALIGGSFFSVSVFDGPPSTAAYLVIGFSDLSAPFKGGTLVPAVDLLVPGLALDANGRLTLLSIWPAGVPQGFETLVQFWMPDVGAPVGFSATNALALIAGG